MSTMDAPDWQMVVTGPSAVTPVINAANNIYNVYRAMGMLGLTMDPGQNTGNHQIQSAGSVLFSAFTALQSGTIKTIYTYVGHNVVCTADENFLCVYDYGETTAATFTLLGHTAAGAIDAALDVVGLLTATLATGVAVTGGSTYAVGLLCNGNVVGLQGIGVGDLHIINPLLANGPVSAASTAHAFTTPPTSVAWSALTFAPQASWYLLGP
jgi:hypothetical protein